MSLFNNQAQQQACYGARVSAPKITVSGNKFRSNEEEFTLNTSGDAHRPTQRVLPGSEAAPAFGDPKLQTNPCQQKTKRVRETDLMIHL